MIKDFISNNQRRYLGLPPISDDWDIVEFTNRMFQHEHTYLIFDGDVIRRIIRLYDSEYEEIQVCESTTENRTLLLPKTKRGKPKILNYSATESIKGQSNYFYVCKNKDNCSIRIANYTTQQTYIDETIPSNGNMKDDVQKWLQKWIDESTAEDLEELDRFTNAKRIHQHYQTGDFFAFRLSRREWGFGRILMVVNELKKDPYFIKQKNYGLTHLMGQPLIINLYHKISSSPNIRLEELKGLPTLPAQAIFDNCFYYGEYPIIGNQPVSPEEYDPLISLGQGLSNDTRHIVYLQYGLIYKETTLDKIKKVFPEFNNERYRNESIGWTLNIDNLRKCIEERSNINYWTFNKRETDLRSPQNAVMKQRLFDFFGLDANKSYAENLKKENKK